MRLIVAVFLICAVVSGGMHAGGQSLSDGPQRPTPPPRPTRVVLTNGYPEGSFLVAPELLASPPPVLALTFTQVINPAKTPFRVLVYFSYQPAPEAGRRTGRAKILLGKVVPPAPDRPAGFLLPASKAFAKIKAAGSKATDVRLQLEIKRIHPKMPWTQVEVTVGPPEWRDEPGN